MFSRILPGVFILDPLRQVRGVWRQQEDRSVVVSPVDLQQPTAAVVPQASLDTLVEESEAGVDVAREAALLDEPREHLGLHQHVVELVVGAVARTEKRALEQTIEE